MRLASDSCRKGQILTKCLALHNRRNLGHLPRSLTTLNGKIPPGDKEEPKKNRFKDLYQAKKEVVYDKLRNSNTKYEEFIGLTDVQAAQERVKQAEDMFLAARTKERQVLRAMVETREKLKDVRERLSHVDYSNTMYLQLASDQHELVNLEERQKRELEEAEDHERDSFMDLSTAMRDSYEKERARVERTKNWSIIGTVIGALIGMTGSVYMNRVRTKDLMKAVKDAGSKELVEEKLASLALDFDKKHEAIAATLGNVAENLVEMGNALQIHNLQVMAGFVEDTLRDDGNSAPEKHGKNRAVLSTSLQGLTDELTSYNVALNSLVNAVTALSKAGTMSPADEERGAALEALLKDQIDRLNTLQADLAEMTTMANKKDWAEMTAKLDDLHRRMALLASPAGWSDGQVYYEVPIEEQSKGDSDWVTGAKDVALWGSLLCCLYMFANF